MVYEKASVLLGSHEFGVFDELVRRYLAGHVDVVRLVGSLLELFRSPEKVGSLYEKRLCLFILNNAARAAVCELSVVSNLWHSDAEETPRVSVRRVLTQAAPNPP